ncbi:MAG TPA: CDF family Co(II)/Ni(II) efflux transporter DmeF [Rhizomicrobium sp.]|nr:CDF family Co(II)/Ni(II) efflux transporter DmeF [Rhizomicrobium sp.]
MVSLKPGDGYTRPMAHNHAHSGDPHSHGIWTHGHVFLGYGHERSESRAKLAALVTALFMLVEIVAGLLFHSMALLADGVHMATHVGALGLAAGAYWLARRHAANARFSFGSGKFGDLAAFSSAIVLGLTAVAIAAESISRLIHPAVVAYGQALLIACIGLGVNLVSALILKDDHSHNHDHRHDNAHAHLDHSHGHGDNNMRAAYIHVLADAGTSLLAIIALACGYYFGLGFLDPLAALVGAFVIASWAYGLIRDSAMVLLDADADPKMSGAIKSTIERDLGARVADLHLWRLGPGHQGLIVSLVSPGPTTAEEIKAALRVHYPDLSHVTVEVAVCADCA